MTTSPETAPVEKKRTLDEMLDADGFSSWLERVPAAKGLNMSDANRDQVEKFYKAWEASKAVAEKSEEIYNQKLASEELGNLTSEEAAEIAALVGNEAVLHPESMVARQEQFELLEKLPKDIAAGEQELAELAAKTGGIDDLKQKIKEAKEKNEDFKKGTADLPKEVQLTVRESLSRLFERWKPLGKSLDQKIKDAKDDKNTEAEAKFSKLKKRLEEEEKIAKTRADIETKYQTSFSAAGWKNEVGELDSKIKQFEEDLKNRETGKTLLDATTERVKQLKEQSSNLRRQVCAKIPVHAAVHKRVSEEVQAKLISATSSKELYVIEEAVQETRRLEALAKSGGSGSSYLDDLPVPVSEYKTDINAQIELVVNKMLVKAIDEIPTGVSMTLFESELQEFMDKARAGLGFKTPDESRRFVIGILEEQRKKAAKNPGTGRATYLSRLIWKLAHGK
ncbi:MAG: hypothetical protein A2849_03885 [Candidatus Taylorbacteria bacterium RIFCSPHIGHO2_01_FULL_51_15]|uniref:Uncharacterized protein n=1 Tax=Candidatus Taylorbacteria bacterium RIFCSPHIGHO2_01_FULL_51_15 TaxID=1802304 RepID=A0A1G2MCA6_9BACT|nr:MAG: hypothetical protein A2849_03885 [Candidatus Taylorbacteria bacterium RIFCSPHIGHO2_01_FULL_51_15]